MTRKVADLLDKLTPDPWRASTPFSTEITEANNRMFAAGEDQNAIRSELINWMQKHQPCLFGRLAARFDLLTICILTERDLRHGDEALREKIQAARTHWTREGFAGRQSGFIILAVSPTLAMATPDQNLQALAQRMCSLYLLQEIDCDRVYNDEVWLEKPGEQRMTWKWLAGVNYFCANGDGRWWQDHRIPGGLAFSINSVGHLAKAGAIARAMNEMDHLLGVPMEAGVRAKVDSLGKALEFAMRTISLASDAVSGKATELMPMPESDLPSPQCPIELPTFLANKDFRYYKGYYHTDFTLPSEYFLPAVERPTHCKARTLEFTYMFDTDLENPDYLTMGAGRRVRGESEKAGRIDPISQPIDASDRLVQALASGDRSHG